MDRKELEEFLRQNKANQEINEEMLIAMARLLYVRFEALQKAGFSEMQAFQIILTRGLA